MGYLKNLLLTPANPVRETIEYRMPDAASFSAVEQATNALAEITPDGSPKLTLFSANGSITVTSRKQLTAAHHKGRYDRFRIQGRGAKGWFHYDVRAAGGRVVAQLAGPDPSWGKMAQEELVAALKLEPNVYSPSGRAVRRQVEGKVDLFLSHAGEDLTSVARPLRDALVARGYRVWLDALTLKVGDSLRSKIDEGLRRSQHGIVILSEAFFRKKWTRRELDGLFTKELIDEQHRILPVWHGMTHAGVAKHSPMLADRFAVSTTEGIDHVVAQLVKAIGRPKKVAIAGPRRSRGIDATPRNARRGGRPPRRR